MPDLAAHIYIHAVADPGWKGGGEVSPAHRLNCPLTEFPVCPKPVLIHMRLFLRLTCVVSASVSHVTTERS